MRRSLPVSMVVSYCLFVSFGHSAPPDLPDGTDAGTRRIPSFKVPAGMKVELFAAEPKLASPVAIGLDERNRVFVAEEYRFNLGTEENRTRPFLLDDDLQIQTLDDRLKMYEKFASKFTGGMDWFRKVADQVRLVEDSDGDGKADRSTVFAPDFNGTLDGLAAGVMAMDGDVYFTCIPNLWRLRDTNNDGVADERTIIHTGFGVNAGFLGHDLHGLCWGPDGKLYFSVGDRGFHITAKEGQTLHGPRNGAVFRCFPDGSELEVVCRGLRNPQELAFDQFGNLFAADNNCDKGDHSRLVYCLEGSDSGWNMAFQSIPDPYLTGPWHAEKTWHLWAGDVTAGIHPNAPAGTATGTGQSADRPAWVLPAVGKLGAGPSGFTYYPGTGLPPKYDHHFFMCNYTGNGGIEAFSIKPRGAGFEIIGEHDFMKPISATDCEFGYDGKLYVSDFVNLIWNGGSSGGRIYTLFDTQHVNDPAVKQTSELVRSGFKSLPPDRLAELLGHADLRIRQRAQFELAARGETGLSKFQATLVSARQLLPRLHALWGLGQLAGKQTHVGDNAASLREQAVAAITAFAKDDDDKIRAWSAKLLGDHRHQSSLDLIAKLLRDKSPRVRLFATLALSKLKYKTVPAELVELIRENNDADPWIRHGCVMALRPGMWPMQSRPANALFSDPSPAVRMALLLADRHDYLTRTFWNYEPQTNPVLPGVAKDLVDVGMQNALRDEDIRIVTEAARAINDLPLEVSYPSLAELIPTLRGSAAATAPEALARRIINANFRLGTAEHAQRVFSLINEKPLSPTIRKEALAALIDWEQPSPRDRVTGFWRAVKPRSPDEMTRLKTFLGENIAALLSHAGSELQTDVVKLIARHQLPTDEKIFAGWISDQTRNATTQTAALRLLTTRKSPLAAASIEIAMKSDRPEVRAEARDMLAILNPGEALKQFDDVSQKETATTLERQRAIAAFATLKQDAADKILKGWLDRLNADQVPEALQLDVLEAATARDLPDLKQGADQFRARLPASDLLGRHRISLQGGDVEKGRDVFLGHRVGQCVRCHKVGTTVAGGIAGPDLHQVATRHDRLSLLQSLIDPNAKIAKGFEAVSLVMNDGRILGGILRQQDANELELEKPDGTRVRVKVSDIEERSTPKSAMPEMNRALSPRELRDVVEYLSTLK
ncbi:MAG: PVC-type heme-binding CxxCH protein [Planctomycetota bacterium]